MRAWILGLALCAAGCSSYHDQHVRAEGASDEHFRLFTGLEGEWYFVDEDGDPTDELAMTYEVTAGGSAVLETVMPDTSSEMITLYYRDGGNLMLTHYCVAGNQPTMIEMPTDSRDVVVFEFLRGTNMDPTSSDYMHDARFEFMDVDRMRATWRQFVGGEPGEAFVMDVARVEP